MQIDTNFDFRTDAGGRDPDKYSRTLRRYHQFLWSKPVPRGPRFELEDKVVGVYLLHRSELGEHFLSSDSVMPTFARWKSMKHILDQIPSEEIEDFDRITYTIGGMMLFPSNKVDGKRTINGARGCHPKIKDRFDLTLECVRRHYLGMTSPLGDTLERYRGYFGLFDDFAGYVDFFLLQDLVTSDKSAVNFFVPFDDFNRPATPKTCDEYREFKRCSIEFVEARNRRMHRYANGG